MGEIVNFLPDCEACTEASKRVLARTMDVDGPGVPGVLYDCSNVPCKARKSAVGCYILRKEIANGKK